MNALNNPGVEDKVQEKEPATIATGTQQCYETGSSIHTWRRDAEDMANSNNTIQ